MSTSPVHLFLSVAAGLFAALMQVEQPALGQMSAIEMHKRVVAPQTEGKTTEAYGGTGDDVQDLASVTTVPRMVEL